MIFESANLRITTDDQIATLWLEVASCNDNAFSLSVLEDLERGLRLLQGMPWIDLLVVRSARLGIFSGGHSRTQLEALINESLCSGYASRGQQVLQLLEQLAPQLATVAYIDGECYGAGLELAMACDYRVAVRQRDVQFGFPEASSGILPCWGGVGRLLRLVGIRKAVPLLLEGRTIPAAEALSLGLIDQLFPKEHAAIDFRGFLEELQDNPLRHGHARKSDFLGFDLPRWLPFLRGRALKDLSALVNEIDENDNPIPSRLKDVVVRSCLSFDMGLRAERDAFSSLLLGKGCQTFLEQKRQLELPLRLFPLPSQPTPAVPTQVSIVGSQGPAIELLTHFASRGVRVIHLVNQREEQQQTLDRVRDLLRSQVPPGISGALEVEETIRLIQPRLRSEKLTEPSLVIVVEREDAGIQRSLFAELEEHVSPRCILASTTTSICIEHIQAELRRPGRVAGLHWPDPHAKGQLVELVHSDITDANTLSTLHSWLRQWKFIPILVGDHPGRMIMRVQLAFWAEAIQLMAEGLPADLVDQEMRRFGLNHGPFTQIDAYGFDRLAELVENLQIATGTKYPRNLLLQRLRSHGLDGKRNQRGFYTYKHGRATCNTMARMLLWRDSDAFAFSHYIFDPEEALDDAVERLSLRCVNEAAAILAEEPDADPAWVDLALSYGLGWAPFLGGPLRYADRVGIPEVIERLHRLAERLGRRFEPCLELLRRGEASETFYGTNEIEVARLSLPRYRKAG